MHSSRMLTVSRVRANPASSIMKPACMKNTRKAVTSTQMVLMGLTMSSIGGAVAASWAPATECRKGPTTNLMMTSTRPTASNFPPR